MIVNISCRTEIAYLRIVRSFFELYGPDGFRYDKMAVCIPLSMRMRNHIDRHIICVQTNVRTMITIEPAQKDLFSFPATLVLTDKKTGYQPKHLLRIIDIPQGHIDLADRLKWLSCSG